MKKSFFRKRTPEEMLENLHFDKAYYARNLIKKMLDLHPDSDGLELRMPIVPMHFSRGAITMAEASRKCYKHGDMIKLSQPESREEALITEKIPLAIRMEDFERKLAGIREEEINYIGFFWYPVQGNDRRKRIVSFPSNTSGVKIYAYAKNFAGGIAVDNRYIDSQKIKKEGATILCRVPSTSKKEQRYDVNLMHVPVYGVTERRAAIWSLRPDYLEGRQPKSKTFQELRYTFEREPESSDVVRFGPHDIAAYIAIIDKFWNKNQFKITPLEMNPFALPSKLGYRFAEMADNNILIYDPTLSGKLKLRNLHLAEKAILQARLIKEVGPEQSVYWDWGRDGMLEDYYK